MDLLAAINPLLVVSGFFVGMLVGLTGVGGGSLIDADSRSAVRGARDDRCRDRPPLRGGNQERRHTDARPQRNGGRLCHGNGVRSREVAKIEPSFMRPQPHLATGRRLRL
jgi:hypothetical protein